MSRLPRPIPPEPPVREAPAAPLADPAAERRRVIAGLRALIYAAGAPAPSANGRYSPEHDPKLRRRSEAVDVLGRFPDPEAAQVLEDLLLRGERDLPAPAGRWLRDTALLALLRSTRLPAAEVDRVLARVYSYLRHPFPWQWPAVYDDLPLLGHYHKLGLFFRAFWIWPLLILAVPTGVEILGWDPKSLALLVVVGVGMEIYLVHQVQLAMLATGSEPLLRLPRSVTPRVIGWLGAGLTLLVAALLAGNALVFASGCSTVTQGDESFASCGVLLTLIELLLPLLLLPMFILAHDLEQAVRYRPKGQDRRLRLWAAVLRRLTDLTYILALPGLALAALSVQQVLGPWGDRLALALFLVYLFAVPLLVTGGLRWIARVWART